MNMTFWQPIQLSIIVAFVATLFVVITGITMAWLMTKKRLPAKLLIETMLLLPIVLPPTVIGFLLIILFGRNGWIGEIIHFFSGQSIIFTITAAIIAAIVVAFPLMYQTVKLGFQSIDRDIEDAARVDGGNEWHIFRFVSLPLCYKPIIAGFILSFARALGEFGATVMFAGNIPGKTQTIPLAIYVAFESNQMQLAWAWVISIVAISFVMLLLLRKVNQ
nr:molybdate ABC transporter permease subunit [Paraliobacillus sp. X-1268]